MKNRLMRLGLLALLAALPACDSALDVADHGRDMAMAARAGNPLRSVDQPQADDERLRGRVAEVARAGSYTYLRVMCEGDAGARWVVTLGRGAEVGDHVAVHNMGTKTNFRSKRLNRTFDELVFGIVRLSAQQPEGEK
jgi:hypothetical protein